MVGLFYVLAVGPFNPNADGPIFHLLPSFSSATLSGVLGAVTIWLVGLGVLLWSLWFFPRALLALLVGILLAPKAISILLGQRLDGYRQTLFRQTLFAEFEWRIHQMGEKGVPITGDSLNALYLDLLKKYYGLWNERQNRRYQQVGEPLGGRVRNDINGTLQGIWFFDHVHDGTWGKKVALFSPYSMNRSNYQMRLSIPEISVYGNWQNMILGSTGNQNLKPHLVNTQTGIVGYTTDWDINTGEEGLLLVQLIDDFHIKLETFEGVYSMPETPEFTEKAVILYR